MDVLSEVLRAVRLEGAVFFNAEFSAPWCLNSSPAGMAPYLCEAASHLIIFHFVTEGRAYVKFPGGRQETLSAGDIVIIPHGHAHLLGNGSHARPVDSVPMLAKSLADELKLARFGGGGEITKFVCGFLACDRTLSEVVLAGLPRMLVVHVADEPSGQWLRDSIRFSVSEARGSSAGKALVIAKLSELLFVETLRRYISGLPAEQTGWLAGARDRHIGQALALLHQDPAHPWTISHLVRRVGLSRTRLAERFRHFLGQSPMAYLAQWRLRLAADILQSTEHSVAEVALSVGYSSEAAFSRAFKRAYDCPPAQFRRHRKAARATTPLTHHRA